MKYSIPKLLAAIAEGDRPKYLFFWGHAPSRNGSVTKSCLSQWWESSFEAKNIMYPSAEHYMMAEKARLFGDTAILEQILNCKTPAEAKKLGRQVQNFEAMTWDAHKFEIVKTGNYHKFSQQAELKEYLRNTKNRVLVEASPHDRIWGIGMAANHPYIESPQHWKGQNLLGFALMEVRDQLM